MAKKLTHIDADGAASMVDVSGKDVVDRRAVAGGFIRLQEETLRMVEGDRIAKGSVLGVARVAGIQAAKKCSDLIPLCHPLMLDSVAVDFELDASSNAVRIKCRCKVSGKTGVEMEALTAASVAALTIYDMCKAVDRGMEIRQIGLLEKSGGKSGNWQRGGDG